MKKPPPSQTNLDDNGSISSLITQALVHEYGLRGAVLLLGACMSHISVSAALYRPLRVQAAIERAARRKREAKGEVETAHCYWYFTLLCSKLL